MRKTNIDFLGHNRGCHGHRPEDLEYNRIGYTADGKIYLKDCAGKVHTFSDSELSLITKVTYSELVSLRNNKKLIPGMQYRITDYECTTILENTKSAGHQFDIIVTADSESVLNENARAINHTAGPLSKPKSTNKSRAYDKLYLAHGVDDVALWQINENNEEAYAVECRWVGTIAIDDVVYHKWRKYDWISGQYKADDTIQYLLTTTREFDFSNDQTYEAKYFMVSDSATEVYEGLSRTIFDGAYLTTVKRLYKTNLNAYSDIDYSDPYQLVGTIVVDGKLYYKWVKLEESPATALTLSESRVLPLKNSIIYGILTEEEEPAISRTWRPAAYFGVDKAAMSYQRDGDTFMELLVKSDYSFASLDVFSDINDYFSLSNIESWQLKYCLDNDTNRFAWAADGSVPTLCGEEKEYNTDRTYLQVIKGTNGYLCLERSTTSKVYYTTDFNDFYEIEVGYHNATFLNGVYTNGKFIIYNTFDDDFNTYIYCIDETTKLVTEISGYNASILPPQYYTVYVINNVFYASGSVNIYKSINGINWTVIYNTTGIDLFVRLVEGENNAIYLINEQGINVTYDDFTTVTLVVMHLSAGERPLFYNGVAIKNGLCVFTNSNNGLVLRVCEFNDDNILEEQYQIGIEEFNIGTYTHDLYRLRFYHIGNDIIMSDTTYNSTTTITNLNNIWYSDIIKDNNTIIGIDNIWVKLKTNKIIVNNIIKGVGKGVIYYMKDEWNNECPYDFKNIMFKRWKISNVNVYKQNASGNTLVPWESYVSSSNDLSSYNEHSLVGKWCHRYAGTGNILVTSNETQWFYTFTLLFDEDYDRTDATIITKEKLEYDSDYIECMLPTDNIIKECISNDLLTLNNIAFCDNYYKSCGNTFGINCYNNTFESETKYNTFGNCCEGNVFSYDIEYNIFGNNFSGNILGEEIYYNIFGEDNHGNIFGSSINYNSFGNGNWNNVFANGIFSNIIGNSNRYLYINYADTIKIDSNCSYIIFGDINNLSVNYRDITIEADNHKICLNSDIGNHRYWENIYLHVKIELSFNGRIINQYNDWRYPTSYKTINDSNINQTSATVFSPANKKIISVESTETTINL